MGLEGQGLGYLVRGNPAVAMRVGTIVCYSAGGTTAGLPSAPPPSLAVCPDLPYGSLGIYSGEANWVKGKR